MRWLGVLVCVVAAYRLSGTPLHTVATVVAALSAVLSAGAVAVRGTSRERLVTGLQHVSTALGGFFLFVSIAI